MSVGLGGTGEVRRHGCAAGYACCRQTHRGRATAAVGRLAPPGKPRRAASTSRATWLLGIRAAGAPPTPKPGVSACLITRPMHRAPGPPMSMWWWWWWWPAFPGSTCCTGCAGSAFRPGCLRRPTTWAAPGTGTATPARAATSRPPTTPTASMPNWKRPGPGLRSTPPSPRSCATRSSWPSATTCGATSISTPCLACLAMIGIDWMPEEPVPVPRRQPDRRRRDPREDPRGRPGPKNRRAAVPQGPPVRQQAALPGHRLLRHLQPAERAAG